MHRVEATVTWSLFFGRSTGERVDVSAHLLSFTGVARHLSGGEWEAKLSPAVWAQLVENWPVQDEPSLQMVLRVPAGVILSGDVRSARFDSAGADQSVTMSGVDEFARLASRLVYPQPDNPPPWNIDAYDTVIGQASAAVAELIRRHIGDLAQGNRVIDTINVRDEGAGMSATWSFRLVDVASAVADIAAEQQLRVDARRQLDGTVDVVVGPVRLRDNLLLDETKLEQFSLTLSPSEATTVIAGGSGEGTSRLFAIAGDAAAGLGRREVFSDQRNISSQPQLQRSADANRSRMSASTSMAGALTVEAASAYEWRTHYELGDTIRLRAFGTTWPVQVSAVNVTVDVAAGLRMTPALGIEPRHALARLLRDVAGLADRLTTVEVA